MSAVKKAPGWFTGSEHPGRKQSAVERRFSPEQKRGEHGRRFRSVATRTPRRQIRFCMFDTVPCLPDFPSNLPAGMQRGCTSEPSFYDRILAGTAGFPFPFIFREGAVRDKARCESRRPTAFRRKRLCVLPNRPPSTRCVASILCHGRSVDPGSAWRPGELEGRVLRLRGAGDAVSTRSQSNRSI